MRSTAYIHTHTEKIALRARALKAWATSTSNAACSEGSIHRNARRRRGPAHHASHHLFGGDEAFQRRVHQRLHRGRMQKAPQLRRVSMAMHQDYPNPEAEIERAIGLGLRGMKLHPDTQKVKYGRRIDSMRIYEPTRAACRLSCTAATTEPISAPAPHEAHPARVPNPSSRRGALRRWSVF